MNRLIKKTELTNIFLLYASEPYMCVWENADLPTCVDMYRSVNLPRPKNETLSRHSFLGQTGLKGQWQGPTAEMKVNFLCDHLDLHSVYIKVTYVLILIYLTSKTLRIFLLDAGSLSKVHWSDFWWDFKVRML